MSGNSTLGEADVSNAITAVPSSEKNIIKWLLLGLTIYKTQSEFGQPSNSDYLWFLIISITLKYESVTYKWYILYFRASLKITCFFIASLLTSYNDDE